MPDETFQTGEAPSPVGLAEDVVASPDTLRPERLPPRQVRTRKWPVLDAGEPAPRPLSEWRFEVSGLVRRPLSWSWEEFQALPHVKVFADMHCVTRWSRLSNLWEGVATRALLERAGVLPNARYVLVRSEGGWIRTYRSTTSRPRTPCSPIVTTAEHCRTSTGDRCGW